MKWTFLFSVENNSIVKSRSHPPLPPIDVLFPLFDSSSLPWKTFSRVCAFPRIGYCSGSHGSSMFSLRVFPRTAGILLYWLSVVHAFCHEPPLDAPRRLLILRLFKGRGEIRFPFTPPCSKRHWTATFIPISGSPLSASISDHITHFSIT